MSGNGKTPKGMPAGLVGPIGEGRQPERIGGVRFEAVVQRTLAEELKPLFGRPVTKKLLHKIVVRAVRILTLFGYDKGQRARMIAKITANLRRALDQILREEAGRRGDAGAATGEIGLEGDPEDKG